MIAHGTDARTIAAGQRIVRWHAGWAAGASFIPLPFVDMAGVMAVQVSMVRRLAHLHGSRMDGARARTLVLSALGGAASPVVTASGIPSMLKVVPGVGTVLGGIAAPGAAAAATVALGNFFNHRFAEGHGPVAPMAAPMARDHVPAAPANAVPSIAAPSPLVTAPVRTPRKRRAKASPPVEATAPAAEPATPPAEGPTRRRTGRRRTETRAATARRPATRKPAGDQPE